MRLPDDINKLFYVVQAKQKIITNGLSVIISIRGASRLQQMYQSVAWALNQTLSPLEVIIVEDGPTSMVDITKFKDYPEVSHLFIKNDRHFCKAACYNHGVSNARYDYICGIDADLLMPSDFLMKGYAALQFHDAAFTASDILYLHEEMADMFDFNFTGKTWQTHRAKWQFHGGSFFIKKQKYFDIGGHDENFKGHGSEDSEFYKRVQDLLTVLTDNQSLLHIDHGRDLADFDRVEANKLYLYGVQSYKLSDRIEILKSTNHYLKGNMLSQSTTKIPDIQPADFDARITRLQELQDAYNRRLISGKPNPKDAAAIIENTLDQRRRRVLGF